MSLTIDENAYFGTGTTQPPRKMPFMRQGVEHLCGHARESTVLSDDIDGTTWGVLALMRPESNGLFIALNAEELRSWAKSLQQLADYVDDKNSGRKN